MAGEARRKGAPTHCTCGEPLDWPNLPVHSVQDVPGDPDDCYCEPIVDAHLPDCGARSYKLINKNCPKCHSTMSEEVFGKEEVSPCPYCGSTKPRVEGDEVHPGYDGWPCCPDCKGV